MAGPMMTCGCAVSSPTLNDACTTEASQLTALRPHRWIVDRYR